MAPGISKGVGSVHPLQERRALKVTSLPFPAELFLHGGKSICQGQREEQAVWWRAEPHVALWLHVFGTAEVKGGPARRSLSSVGLIFLEGGKLYAWGWGWPVGLEGFEKGMHRRTNGQYQTTPACKEIGLNQKEPGGMKVNATLKEENECSALCPGTQWHTASEGWQSAQPLHSHVASMGK